MNRSVALLVVIAGACILLACLGPWADRPFEGAGLFLLAGAAWLAAIVLARRDTIGLRWIVGGAIALRLVALGSDLALSDDVYRLVWEGELVLRGTSPYAFAPDAPELADVRAELPGLASRVGHTSVPAAYPPLTQFAGALGAAIAHWTGSRPEIGGVRALRVLFALCDLLVLVPLFALLRRARVPESLAVVWAWSPLLAFEFAGSGHFDSLGILLTLSALVLMSGAGNRRWIGGLVLLAGGVLVKYLPLVALPWVAFSRRGVLRLALVAALVVAAFVPFRLLRGGSSGFFSGLREYEFAWKGGSLVFRWIEMACVRFLEPATGWGDPPCVARLVCAAIWFAWMTWIFLGGRDAARRQSTASVHSAASVHSGMDDVRAAERVRGTGLAIAGFLVLSPTLHPWYLAWVVPFVALRPSLAWCGLLALAPLLYAPLAGWQRHGAWVEPAWEWPVVALPFFAVLVLERVLPKRSLLAHPPGSA